MAHTIDQTPVRISGSGASVTVNYTCGAGTTVLVVAFAVMTGTLRQGGSPTFNGVALNKSADTPKQHTSSPETSAEMWYMCLPPTGTQYTVSIPNTGTRAVYGYVFSFKAGSGCISVLDVDTSGNAQLGNPGIASINTTVDGDAIVGVIGHGMNAFTTPTNVTAQPGDWYTISDNGNYGDGEFYGLQATAGSYACQYASTVSDDWAQIVMAFKEVVVDAETFIYDGFVGPNGTALSSHAGELGAAWTVSGAGISLDGSGFAANSSTQQTGYASATPPSADYYGEAVINLGSSANGAFYIFLRRLTTELTGYSAIYTYGGNLICQRLVNGNSTSLGNIVLGAGEHDNNSVHTLKYAIAGSEIRLYWDGVEKISASDGTITAANKLAFSMVGTTFKVDNIKAAPQSAFSNLIKKILATETVQFNETPSRNITFRRLIADVLQHVETRLRNLTMLRIKTETENLAETQSRNLTFRRILADTLNLAETRARIYGFVKTISETLNLVEARLSKKVIVQYISDVLNFVETRLSPAKKNRVISDELQLGETNSRTATWRRVIADTVNLVETNIRSFTFRRIIADTVSLVEESLKFLSQQAQAFKEVINETLQLVETRLYQKGILKFISDAVAFVEAKLPARTWRRTINETENLVETTPHQSVLRRIVSDTVQFVESRSKMMALGIKKVINETLNFVESRLSKKVIVQYIADQLSIAETRARVFTFRRLVADVVQAVEAIRPTLTLRRTLNETLNLVEARSYLKGLKRVIADSLSIVEGVVRELAGGFIKVITDSVQLVESRARVFFFRRVVNEALNLAEGVARVFQYRRVQNESLNLQESVGAVRGLLRIVADVVGIVENALTKTLADVIKFIKAVFGFKAAHTTFSLKCPSVSFELKQPSITFQLRGHDENG